MGKVKEGSGKKAGPDVHAPNAVRKANPSHAQTCHFGGRASEHLVRRPASAPPHQRSHEERRVVARSTRISIGLEGQHDVAHRPPQDHGHAMFGDTERNCRGPGAVGLPRNRQAP